MISETGAHADGRGHNGIRSCVDVLGTDVSGGAYFV